MSDYVACRGGDLDGHWYTREGWDIKVLAAERTGIGSAPQYVGTGELIENPHQNDPKKKHLHDIEAEVFVPHLRALTP